jgi:hypothetical protein
MLEYLSGIGRPSRRTAPTSSKRVIKPIAIKKAQAQKLKLSPVVKSKINKLQVQSKIRKAFVKKAEPVQVTEEEIVEEVEKPVEEEQEQPSVESEATERAEERESEDADLGIYYPSFGKPKGKLKNAVKKAGAKAKAGIKKAGAKVKAGVKKLNKDEIAHKLAKVSLALPRGAFLTLLALGKALQKTPIKLNLAGEISKVWAKKGNEIKKFWYKMGGEPSALVKAINKAGKTNLSGDLGLITTATITTAIATATPLIMKVTKILGKAKDFAEKNPKLVAAGNKILKGALDSAKQKAGVTPEQMESLDDIAQTVRKAIPTNAQNLVSTAENNMSDKDIKTVEVQATNDVKEINEQTGLNTTTGGGKKSNKTIMIVGAVALLGAVFLLKGKKNN